jgi:TonB-dependent receptor
MTPAPMAVALAAALASTPAAALDVTVRVHLAAGPAATSVPELARQAGVRVLANGDDLAGVTTAALHGTYGARQALALLLAGTGLEAQPQANGSILIRKVAPARPLPPPAPDGATILPTVHVTGVRAAQQTSIDRKKHADTALDAIVAEDVGTFPDRNAAEAISRIAGVTLERGDYGEGTTVNVRGNAAGYTRVEIDGVGVQTGGGSDLNNGGGGRGVDLRELSTDLIKSIDMVKGATADMTEGSLGGAILIRSRTGLDFDQRYVALRVAGQQNTINRRTTPNLNLVFADKFLDNRLGVIVNLGGARARNENHTMSVSSRDVGMVRLIDFDGSPDKTFSYQPATVSTTDPAASAPLQRWARSGGGTLDSLSPLEIVTRSASAATKDACRAAFPAYTADELGTLASNANRAAAQSQRANELLSCLNQWNDYTPQNLRYQVRRQDERRWAGDVRLDFKVSQQLSVYAKATRNSRKIDDDQLFFSAGGLNINGAGRYVDSAAAGGQVRTPLAGGSWYPTPVNAGTVNGTWQGLTDGSVVNVVPGSVAVDANHHVTGYTLSNMAINNDQIYDRIASRSRYTEIGGAWRAGRWQADVLAGVVKAEGTRMQWRTNLGFSTGQTAVTLDPDGWWLAALPSNVGAQQLDPQRYGVLQAPLAAGLPAVSASTQLTLANPRLMERREATARLDLRYATGDTIPWLSRIKFGGNRRHYTTSSWNGQGYTVQAAADGNPAVVVPRAVLNSSFQACQDTAASLGPGGTPCRYGATFSSTPGNALTSTIVMTQADYRAIVGQALTPGTVGYFNSLPNRPAALLNGWSEIDVRRVIAATGVANFNLDCVRTCTGSDGRRYEQPRTGVSERINAGYVSADFQFDGMPAGGDLEGNIGWRVVRTDVAATGMLTLQSAGANNVVGARAGNITLRSGGTDVMPMLNLAWWVAPDRLVLRFARAKAIARPLVEYLISNGVTCTYDQAVAEGADMGCSGTMGNPGLKPLANRNYNLSAEWYPDRDTVVSLAGFRQRGITGAPMRVAVVGARPFDGADVVDPATGAALSDVRYAFATYVNGPAITRHGVEVSVKTAFSRLPWLLRHTGLDANYARQRSASVDGAFRDLLTGAALAPAGEMQYTWNASLWYDDGALRARVALQSAAGYFRGPAALANNYPATGIVGSTTLPLNPGSATFRDATRFIDARIAYRVSRQLEVFAEGRNLGRRTVSNSQSAVQALADGTPNLLDRGYYGAQYMVGLNLKY